MNLLEVTSKDVIEAYKRNGFTPAPYVTNPRFADRNACCAIGALADGKSTEGIIMACDILEIDEIQARVFAQGFDTELDDTAEWEPLKSEPLYIHGKNIGREVKDWWLSLGD